ncbi:uncharacterized protein LOC126176956 [Schistocerca cancellata]|uniref:uncharacterized protein LOC126176956 n=1 Tax=Schistocerca cancellata TaxID=274614 RepID=UPI0021190377|nr:uncharacterized protein LOC126176956 [Schistocerca cancellata]
MRLLLVLALLTAPVFARYDGDRAGYTYDDAAYTYDDGGSRYDRCRDAAWSRRDCLPTSHNRIVSSRPDRWAAKSRVRMGNGGWRALPGGAAELHCLFPVPLLSNVVWTRVDRSGSSSRIHSQGHLWPRPLPGGSALLVDRASPLDVGLYRCLATALHPRSGPVTVFQDVHFQPYF